MFCIVCGKKLHSEYKYLACQHCFDEKRESFLKQEAVNSPEWISGITGFSGPTGVTGFSDPSFESVQVPSEMEDLPPAYFIYSERATNPYHEGPEKKNGRLLRPIEGDESESDNLL